jgi:hypothetical protein
VVVGVFPSSSNWPIWLEITGDADADGVGMEDKRQKKKKALFCRGKNIYGETPTITALNTQKSCSGPKLPPDRTMSDVIHTLPRILLLLLYYK